MRKWGGALEVLKEIGATPKASMKQVPVFSRVGLCVLAATIALVPSGVGAIDRYPEESLRRDVLGSELIVRGVITSLGSATVPRDSLFVVKTGRQYPVTIIELQITDVVKGQWSDPTMRAVIQGGPGKGSFILEYDYDYEVGEEVVLCLHYDPRMLAGAFWIWGNSGTFVRRGHTFVSRGKRGSEVTLDSIVGAANALAPSRTIPDADAVVLGEIEAIDLREFDCGFPMMCTADYATVRVTESWKGPLVGERILVRAVRRGTNLSWYAPVPPLAPGQVFLMFLKRDAAGFYPFVGFNGFLGVEGERLLVNGSLAHPLSKSRMLETVRQETAR